MIYLFQDPLLKKFKSKNEFRFFGIFNFMGTTNKSEKLHEITCK